MGPVALIVIVNPRTSGPAIDCPEPRVVVGLNPAGDGSVEKLQAAVAERDGSRRASDRNERRCA
jgi:hypothetical protein